jgi:predicted metal-dependent hydrolase
MICYLKIGTHDIPVKVIQEWRRSTRVALGKEHVILRIPKTLFQDQMNAHLLWASKWLHQVDIKKPNLLLRYVQIRKYENGSACIIGGREFILSITPSSSGTATIKLVGGTTLAIEVPFVQGVDTQKVIKKLLSGFFCRFFLPEIKTRVKEINDQYFGQSYRSVRLKYNSSNWGSCSGDRNLNFSVRLFFAPPDVRDYVIVHELAHLLEMNHSPKFWNIVEKIMPDYESKEKMLKVNSHEFDF